jgi:hypothetical protein
MSSSLDANLTTLVVLLSVYTALHLVKASVYFFMDLLSYFRRKEDMDILKALLTPPKDSDKTDVN